MKYPVSTAPGQSTTPPTLRCRSAFPGRPDRIVPWPDEQSTALLALRAGQQPIASSCSGETVCGRCVVQIIGGADALPPAEPDELAVLAVYGAEPGERLACRLLREDASDELVLSTHYW